jgi:hypothetical protein
MLLLPGADPAAAAAVAAMRDMKLPAGGEPPVKLPPDGATMLLK